MISKALNSIILVLACMASGAALAANTGTGDAREGMAAPAAASVGSASLTHPEISYHQEWWVEQSITLQQTPSSFQSLAIVSTYDSLDRFYLLVNGTKLTGASQFMFNDWAWYTFNMASVTPSKTLNIVIHSIEATVGSYDYYSSGVGLISGNSSYPAAVQYSYWTSSDLDESGQVLNTTQPSFNNSTLAGPIIFDLAYTPAAPVPEPASYAMLLGGLGLLGGIASRRRKTPR